MEQNKADKLLYTFANAYCTMNNAGRQEAKYAATPAVEAAKQAVIDHFCGAAVRGEAVEEFSYKDADGKFLDSGPWWVENSEINAYMALPILRNGEVIAMVFAEAVDGCREAVEENCRLLCGAANSAAPVAGSEPTDFIELLRSIRPNYGAVGSRDVDVSAMRKKIAAAITILSARAADAPSDPSEKSRKFIDNVGYREEVWRDAQSRDPKSRAADALDSQPTVSAVLAELRSDLRELANNTETFGEHRQEAARVALDGATDALDEVAAKYASSQPTDGGVRNG